MFLTYRVVVALCTLSPHLSRKNPVIVSGYIVAPSYSFLLAFCSAKWGEEEKAISRRRQELEDKNAVGLQIFH